VKTRQYRVGLVLVCFVTGALLLFTQATTIYGGDAGDLVSAIATKGIPHPPGFPLYTALGVAITTLFTGGTLAFRTGLLSSIPTVICTLFLFDLTYRLTKSSLIAVISSLTFSFSYLVWLYGIVPEVFALNNAFTVLLLWCSYRLIESRRKKFLRLMVFLFALSLTHHQIIVFLVPSLLFAVFVSRLRFNWSEMLKLCALFVAGLLPYVYVFISAPHAPALNWMGEATIARFISLVSREGYGTFRAGPFAVLEYPLRLLSIAAFGEFLWRDLRPAGVFLGAIGSLLLFFTRRNVWGVYVLSYIFYVFFLFYASFPLHQEFMLGTFERFMLPLYLIMSLFIGYGIYVVVQLLSRLVKKSFATSIATVLFLILPVGLLLRNYSTLSPIKDDRTAENLALDIVSTVEEDAILFLSTDTPLFNTQYLYYSSQKWPNVKLIHFTKLFTPYYPAQISAIYPEIYIPKETDEPEAFFDAMLTHNAGRYPIYSKQVFTTSAGSWVPWGLLFRFYPKGREPKSESIASLNDSLWKGYHDPFSGVLTKFRHLILNDVLRVYAISHQETAFFLAKNGFDKSAEKHLLSAISLDPSDTDSYIILAQVYSRLGLCDKSEEMIQKRRQVSGRDDTTTYLLSALNERLCRKNNDTANRYKKLFEQSVTSDSTRLDKLL